jgi:biopolymer transport protein TolR
MAFGRFDGRQRTPQPMSEINVTPMVDVMLVLVVIFIITAPLLVSAVKVELPRADGGTALQAPAFVALSIDRQGQVYVADQPLPDDAVRLALGEAARHDARSEVQLRADAMVPYGRVLEVMGWAQRAGLGRIGFVAQPPVPASSDGS